MARTVKVTIDESGDCTVDLEGFHGQGCAAVMKDFTDGGDVVSEITKREFHEEDGQSMHNLETL